MAGTYGQSGVTYGQAGGTYGNWGSTETAGFPNPHRRVPVSARRPHVRRDIHRRETHVYALTVTVDAPLVHTAKFTVTITPHLVVTVRTRLASDATLTSTATARIATELRSSATQRVRVTDPDDELLLLVA